MIGTASPHERLTSTSSDDNEPNQTSSQGVQDTPAPPTLRYDWRLLPMTSTRQLVVVVGFGAAIAYIAVATMAINMLTIIPLRNGFGFLVAAVAVGASASCGLIGLVWLAVRTVWRARARQGRLNIKQD